MFIRVRSPSPEVLNEVNTDSNLFDSNGDIHDVYSLPAPLPRKEVWPRNRVPSPITVPKEELNLDYASIFDYVKTRIVN